MQTYVRTDKNGTKIYHDDTCQRCGGQGGSDSWRFTGVTCYECGGSGRSKVREIKQYTPEYRAKLDAKAKVLADKKEVARREELKANQLIMSQTFMDTKLFGGVETIAVVKGDTYSIKEELKEEGCKYQNGIGWYCKETSREAYIIPVAELTEVDNWGILGFKNVNDLYTIVKKHSTQDEPNVSNEYVGTVGDKLQVEVTIQATISYDTQWGTSYIILMVDAEGHQYKWSTASPFDMEKGEKHIVKGTIKAHNEYKEVKQTVLTRVKEVV